MRVSGLNLKSLFAFLKAKIRGRNGPGNRVQNALPERVRGGRGTVKCKFPGNYSVVDINGARWAPGLGGRYHPTRISRNFLAAAERLPDRRSSSPMVRLTLRSLMILRVRKLFPSSFGTARLGRIVSPNP